MGAPETRRRATVRGVRAADSGNEELPAVFADLSMQLHFNFTDWEQAFSTYYRRRLGYAIADSTGKVIGFAKGDSSLVFVVSTDAYTSGYWIEKDGEDVKSDAHNKVYRKVSEVRGLEKRVRQEQARTVNLSLDRVIA